MVSLTQATPACPAVCHTTSQRQIVTKLTAEFEFLRKLVAGIFQHDARTDGGDVANDAIPWRRVG
jgi:hypothetical protein